MDPPKLISRHLCEVVASLTLILQIRRPMAQETDSNPGPFACQGQAHPPAHCAGLWCWKGMPRVSGPGLLVPRPLQASTARHLVLRSSRPRQGWAGTWSPSEEELGARGPRRHFHSILLNVSGSESHFGHTLAMSPWPSHLTFLSLHFLTCKNRIIIAASLQHYGEN